MKKLTKIFSFALAFVCLSLCFAGCSFGKEAELSSIDLSTPLQNEFCLGETLDLTGKKLTLTYKDKTQKEIDLTESMFTTKLDTTTATTTEQRSMVIKYKEETITCNYTVLNAKKVGSNKLYFDKAYTLTLVKTYKNGTYVGNDNNFYSSSMEFKSDGTGTAHDSADNSFTWTINESNNTITLIASGSNATVKLTLNEDGLALTVTYSSSFPYYSTYDTEVRIYTLQNA